MTTLADQLLHAAATSEPGLERAVAADHLEEIGRSAEAERLRQPGRVIYRWTHKCWWIDLRPAPLRTYHCFRESRPARDTGHRACVCHVSLGEHRALLPPLTRSLGYDWRELYFGWGAVDDACGRLALAILLHLTGKPVAQSLVDCYAIKYLAATTADAWATDEEVIWQRIDALTMLISAVGPMDVSLLVE